MKMISIENAEEGMVLAGDITAPSGQVLLPKGALLTEGAISSLSRHNVLTLSIVEPEDTSRKFTQEEILQAESICMEKVKARIPEDPSSRVMKELFRTVLRIEAMEYLSHGKND